MHSQKNAVCGRPRQKTHHSHLSVNSLAPPRFTAQCVCVCVGHNLTVPRQLIAINICWRPNAVADQHQPSDVPVAVKRKHYVESGLLRPSDCNASVRNHPRQVLFEFA